MHAKLVVVAGNSTKREVKLRLPVIVGRSRDAGLSIVHPTVSRRHCELFERDGLLMVNDFGSLNGTLVGNTKVTEAVVRPGEQLTIGPLTFMAIYDPPKSLVPKRKSDSSWSKLEHNDLLAAGTHAARALAPTTEELPPIVDDEVSRIDVSTTAASAWVPAPATVEHPAPLDPGVYDSGELFEGQPPPADLVIDDAPLASSESVPAVPAPYGAPLDLAQTSSWQPPPDWQDEPEPPMAAAPESPLTFADEADAPSAGPESPSPVAKRPATPPYDFQDAISEELDLLFDDGGPETLSAGSAISAAPLPTAEPIPTAHDDLDGFLESRESAAEPIAIQPVDLDGFLESDSAELVAHALDAEIAAEAPPVTAEPSAPTDEVEPSLPPIPEVGLDSLVALDVPETVDASDLFDLNDIAPDDVAGLGLVPAHETPPQAENSESPEHFAIDAVDADLELASDEIEVSPDAWAPPDTADAAEPEPIIDVDRADIAELAEVEPAIELEVPDFLLSEAPAPATDEPLGLEPLPTVEVEAGDGLLSPEVELTVVSSALLFSATVAPPDLDLPLELLALQDVAEVVPELPELEATDFGPPEFEALETVEALNEVEPAEIDGEEVESDEPLAEVVEEPAAEAAAQPLEPAAPSPEIETAAALHVEDDPPPEFSMANLLDDEPSEIEPEELPDFDDVTPLSELTPAEGSIDAALLAPADELLPGALHPELAEVTPVEFPKIDEELDSSVLPVFDAGETDNPLHSAAAAGHVELHDALPHAAPVPAEPDLDDALFAFDSLDETVPTPEQPPQVEAASGDLAALDPPLESETALRQIPAVDLSSDLTPPHAPEERPVEDASAWSADEELVVPLLEVPVPAMPIEAAPIATLAVESAPALEDLAADILFAEDAGENGVAATENAVVSASVESADVAEMHPRNLPKPPIEYDSWEDVPMPVPSRPTTNPATSPNSAAAPPAATAPPAADVADDHRPKARKWVPPQADADTVAAEAAKTGSRWWPFGRKTVKNQEAAALHMAADIRHEKMTHGQPLAPPPPPKPGLFGFLRRKPAPPVEEMFAPPTQHPAGPWSNTPPPVAAATPPAPQPAQPTASASPVAKPVAKVKPAPPAPATSPVPSKPAAPREAIPPVVVTKTVASAPVAEAPAPAAQKSVLGTEELDEFLRDLG